MAQKQYKIRFYEGKAKNTASNASTLPHTIAQLLTTEAQHQAKFPTVGHTFKVGENSVELRDIKSTKNNSVYMGILALLRTDAPHKRDAQRVVSKLPLQATDTLLEMNHFLFYPKNNLLVWQTNGSACHYSNLAGLLTMLSGNQTTVVFSDILSSSALTKINSGSLKKLSVTFAAPRTAVLHDPTDWSQKAIRLANDAENATVTVSIGVGRTKSLLPESFKSLLKDLVTKDEVKALHASIAGQKDPIDLFAECIKDSMVVNLIGHYPQAADVFAELERSTTDQKVELDAHFGT